MPCGPQSTRTEDIEMREYAPRIHELDIVFVLVLVEKTTE